MSCTGVEQATDQGVKEDSKSTNHPPPPHHLHHDQPTKGFHCLPCITENHSYAKRSREAAKPLKTQVKKKAVCRAKKKTMSQPACKDPLTANKPEESKQVRWPKCVISYTGKTYTLKTINRRNTFGETFLLRAVLDEDLLLLKDILQLGPDVNMADNAGWTPLHEAVLSDQYEACEVLIKAGALVNAVAHSGDTALHDAIAEGHDMIAELLLKHGADPLLKDKDGVTALDMNTKPSLEQLMVESICRDGPRPPAAPGNRYEEMPVLSDTGGSEVSPPEDHGTAEKDLHPTPTRSHEDRPSATVLYKGIKVSVANVNKRNGYGQTLLHRAAEEGNANMVLQLLLLGADVNMADNAGWTALHEAALSGHYQVTLDLIQAGALVHAVAYNGETALDDAIANGHVEIAEALKQCSVEPFKLKEAGDVKSEIRRDGLPAPTQPDVVSVEALAGTLLEQVSGPMATDSKEEDPQPNDTGMDHVGPPSQNLSPAVVMQELQIEPTPSPEVRATSAPRLLFLPATPPSPFQMRATPPAPDAAPSPSRPKSQAIQPTQPYSTPPHASALCPPRMEDCDSDQTVDYQGDSSDESVDWAFKATQNFHLASVGMEAHTEDNYMYTFPTEMA